MSQAATILRLLTEARGEWVELTTLAREAGCYAVSERCSELRKRGYNIINKTLRVTYHDNESRKQSWYRLAAAAVAEATTTPSLARPVALTASPDAKHQRAAAATDLFGLTTGDTHHDY
jgi:hypothetical protein